jgi:hypothetical protein
MQDRIDMFLKEDYNKRQYGFYLKTQGRFIIQITKWIENGKNDNEIKKLLETVC